MNTTDIIFIILCFIAVIAVVVIFAQAFAPSSHGHFDEADSDAQFSESPTLRAVASADYGPLVEVDTAGVPTPPNEVSVYEYLWNPALSAYELSRVLPLSEYHLHGSDPELAQILSRTQPPAVIPGAPVKARRGEPEPESEAAEIERRLQAPAFHDRTNHGAPIDKPRREF
jgi:hypothetical protein